METECVICMQISTKEQTLACLHTFCDDCINNWLSINNRCPICASIIGNQSINSLSKYENELCSPCIDHLYPERNNLQLKLLHMQKRIQTKNDASMKACISKMVLIELKSMYQEIEELFDLFSQLVDQGGDISDAVGLMETINFRLLAMEQLLQGRSRSFDEECPEWFYDETAIDFDEDEFFEMKPQTKTHKKRDEKTKHLQSKKFVK